MFSKVGIGVSPLKHPVLLEHELLRGDQFLQLIVEALFLIVTVSVLFADAGNKVTPWSEHGMSVVIAGFRNMTTSKYPNRNYHVEFAQQALIQLIYSDTEEPLMALGVPASRIGNFNKVF